MTLIGFADKHWSDISAGFAAAGVAVALIVFWTIVVRSDRD